jgi:hypothetical protein
MNTSAMLEFRAGYRVCGGEIQHPAPAERHKAGARKQVS